MYTNFTIPPHLTQQQQLKWLQQNLLQICPDSQNQIAQMTRQDLCQLLAASNFQNNQAGLGPTHQVAANQAVMNEQQHQRRILQQKLLPFCPDMQDFIKKLPLQDLKQVYRMHVQKQAQNQQKQHSREAPFQKNGQLNVAEMKKILMEKQPSFRNQIKNMKDQEIRVMFKQIKKQKQRNVDTLNKKNHQDVFNYSQNINNFQNTYSSTQAKDAINIDSRNHSNIPRLSNNNQPIKPTSNFNVQMQTNGYMISQFGKRGRKRDPIPIAYNYGTNPISGPHENIIPTRKPRYRQNNQNYISQNIEVDAAMGMPSAYDGYPKIKSQIKADKAIHKHKCKITFYLNESDFQEDQEQTKQIKNNLKNGTRGNTQLKNQNILSKIMEAFSIALNNTGYGAFKQQNPSCNLKDLSINNHHSIQQNKQQQIKQLNNCLQKQQFQDQMSAKNKQKQLSCQK